MLLRKEIDEVAKIKEKHPSWFKMKIERRELKMWHLLLFCLTWMRHGKGTCNALLQENKMVVNRSISTETEEETETDTDTEEEKEQI